MKHILITIIAAVLVVGCGPSEADRALLKAAERGNIKAIKQHLAAGTDVNAKDYNGDTPLHKAANEGHEEIAELLIAEGADVNAWGGFGRTPLDVADGVTANLLRKHGGKTGEELKAEGN
jgi:ankyrin repeat protein